jgi:hypothetical protein
MNKKIKNVIKYFGFIQRNRPDAIYPDDLELNELFEDRLGYLKASEQQEAARLTTIESKMSQLVGQTGIILTLLGLFVSTFLGRASAFPTGFKILLIFLFLVALFFYLATIFHATKHFNIGKYKYGRRDASTVKKTFESKEALQLEEIKDLLYTIEQNTGLNDSKGDDLMYGYRTFQVGTLCGALLILVLIASSFIFNKVDTPKVRIENEVKISKLDSNLVEIQRQIKNQDKHHFLTDTILFEK